jgi:hypothetical protein
MSAIARLLTNTAIFAVLPVDFRRNWDFRFSRSLPSDGTAQRKINVEHTLVWPDNPAAWGVGTRGTKIGIAAPPARTAKHALLIFDALRTVYGTNLTLCSVVLFAAGSQGSLGRF